MTKNGNKPYIYFLAENSGLLFISIKVGRTNKVENMVENMRKRFFDLAVILIIFTVCIAGCFTGSGSTPDKLITKDISQMGLTINEVIPENVQSGMEPIMYTGGCNTTSATFEISKFSTIEGAKKGYRSYLDSLVGVTGTKKAINIGNEGYSVAVGSNYCIVFRRGNIYAVIDSFSNPLDTDKCAQILDNKLTQ